MLPLSQSLLGFSGRDVQTPAVMDAGGLWVDCGLMEEGHPAPLRATFSQGQRLSFSHLIHTIGSRLQNAVHHRTYSLSTE